MDGDKIYIFDTTLRDGEQSPGFSMNIEEKLIFADRSPSVINALSVLMVAFTFVVVFISKKLLEAEE